MVDGSLSFFRSSSLTLSVRKVIKIFVKPLIYGLLDILSDYSEKSMELVKNIIGMKNDDKCRQILACKMKTILAMANLENLLLSSNCTERLLENNICN